MLYKMSRTYTFIQNKAKKINSGSGNGNGSGNMSMQMSNAQCFSTNAIFNSMQNDTD